MRLVGKKSLRWDKDPEPFLEEEVQFVYFSRFEGVCDAKGEQAFERSKCRGVELGLKHC